MITVFDSSNYAQQIFLKEAYATLAATGEILNQDELAAGKFLSLDGYFAHMLHLVKENPKFTMIPSDESPFEIDANTRSIKIPAAFSKCAGVVGDNMCEIITFTIDRYFDYVDLANAYICIQWKLPAKQGEEAEEGISHINLKDLTTVSGKIRFGWPLTSALTKTPGNITFAVRFYVEEEVADADGIIKKKPVYLFNTLPATIPIRESLNLSGAGVYVEEGIGGLFEAFVKNSKNPSYPMPQPVAYVVNLPGEDDPQKVDEYRDTLVLRAQATTTGEGYISYKWYFKVDTSDKTDLSVPAELITKDHPLFEVDDNVYEEVVVNWEKNGWNDIPRNKQYFMDTGSNSAETKVPVHYKLEGGKVNFYTATGEAIPERTPLFERYTQLTIRARSKDENGEWITTDENKKITGLYYVEAYNTVGQDLIEVKHTATTADGQEVELVYHVPGINSTAPERSNECYVPVPKDVIIPEARDLQRDIFIDPEAVLTVVPEKDGGNPLRKFNWRILKDDEEISEDQTGKWIASALATPEDVIENEEDKIDRTTITTQTPGWYYVDIVSQLNRDTREAQSSIARVINKPQKPTLLKAEYAPWGDLAKYEPNSLAWTTVYEVVDGQGVIVDENGYESAAYGSVASLRVNIQDLSSRLLSDKVTYEWYVIFPDDKVGSTGTLITEDKFGPNSYVHEINSIDSNVLNVRCTHNPSTGETVNTKEAYAYYCKITNTLADESSVLDYKDYTDEIKVMFLIH